jgi:hypothetical protein
MRDKADGRCHNVRREGQTGGARSRHPGEAKELRPGVGPHQVSWRSRCRSVSFDWSSVVWRSSRCASVSRPMPTRDTDVDAVGRPHVVSPPAARQPAPRRLRAQQLAHRHARRFSRPRSARLRAALRRPAARRRQPRPAVPRAAPSSRSAASAHRAPFSLPPATISRRIRRLPPLLRLRRGKSTRGNRTSRHVPTRLLRAAHAPCAASPFAAITTNPKRKRGNASKQKPSLAYASGWLCQRL